MTITKACAVLAIVLAGFLQSQELAAQSQSKTVEGAAQAAEGSMKKGEGAAKAAEGSMKKGEGEMAKAEMGQGGKVLLHETFDKHDIDSSPEILELERVDQVTVVDGGGKAGEGKVAHFNDADEELGAMEYNLGDSELGSMLSLIHI